MLALASYFLCSLAKTESVTYENGPQCQNLGVSRFALCQQKLPAVRCAKIVITKLSVFSSKWVGNASQLLSFDFCGNWMTIAVFCHHYSVRLEPPQRNSRQTNIPQIAPTVRRKLRLPALPLLPHSLYAMYQIDSEDSVIIRFEQCPSVKHSNLIITRIQGVYCT